MTLSVAAVAAHAADLDLASSSFGAAGQVGADFPVKDDWFANVDVKEVFIASDVEIGGNRVAHASLHPWLLGLGVGIRYLIPQRFHRTPGRSRPRPAWSCPPLAVRVT